MMNTASKAALSFFSACCLLAAACALRVVPSARIWSGYQVVFFPNSQDLSFLNESSIGDLFPGLVSDETSCRSDAVTPPDFTVAESVYHGMYIPVMDPFNRDGYTSDTIRSFFFSDREGNYRLVYVPDAHFRSFCSLLDSKKIPYGTDSTVKVPYGGALTVLVLALVLVILVRVRWQRLIMLVPVCTMAFLAPWYAVSCTACTVLALVPFINRYWNRVQGGRLFIRNPLCIVFLVLLAGLLVLTPPRPLLVSLLCLSSSACFGFAVRMQEQWAAGTRHFSFTPIISGRFVTVDERQKGGAAVLYSLSVLVLLSLSLFSTVGGSLSDRQDLSLPGPNRYTDSITSVDGWNAFADGQDEVRYPDITDFVAELWQRQSYGFRRISQRNDLFPQKGSAVTVSHFVEDADGVHVIQKDVLVFDDTYLNRSMEWLREHDSVAAFLLQGNATASTTYTTTGAFTVTAADYAGILACITVAAGLCMVLVIRRARQRSSEK
ncbi:MAG: hypothetical protein MJ178_00295 [Treponemataceae bacterium]|nr:hypothetical protein [Treponemataceae bacterium]